MIRHLLAPPLVVRRWVCQWCNYTAVTIRAECANRYHPCANVGLAIVPMLLVVDDKPVGRARIVARQDYVRDEIVPYDHRGQAVMGISTDRPDGSNDLVVFAPPARLDLS